MSLPHCPKCQTEFKPEDVRCNAWIPANQAPQREPVADLLLECEECGFTLNAFLGLSDFIALDPDYV
jgi:hypothetical protein